MPERFICLVPAGDEFHIATRGGRVVTTTERSQIGLRKIEGRRPPVVLADNVGDLPTVDLMDLVLDQGQTSSPAPTPAESDTDTAAEKAPPVGKPR